MKKVIVLLVLVVFTVCAAHLMGFAFGHITPVAQAAGEAQRVVSGAGLAETASVPLAPAAQPVAFILLSLVCILFGVLALAPLLLNEPGG